MASYIFPGTSTNSQKNAFRATDVPGKRFFAHGELPYFPYEVCIICVKSMQFIDRCRPGHAAVIQRTLPKDRREGENPAMKPLHPTLTLSMSAFCNPHHCHMRRTVSCTSRMMSADVSEMCPAIEFGRTSASASPV